MRQLLLRLMSVLVLPGVLAGCGECSSSAIIGDDLPLQPLVYEGSTTPVTITTANAKSLVNAAFGSSAGDIAALSGASGGDAGDSGAVRVAERVGHRLRAEASRAAAPANRFTAAAAVNELHSCVNAGSLNITGEVDEASGLGTLTFRYRNCIEFGMFLDGEVIFRVSAGQRPVALGAFRRTAKCWLPAGSVT